jgi:hypothetical protein
MTQKEKNLYNSWLHQAFETINLHTISGQTLSILKPGERNETEGPDFHDAMILIDDRFEQGDVELHVNSDDWYRHNHNLDPHYDAVILHVVLKTGKMLPIRTNQNRIIPTLQITPFEKNLDSPACEQWKPVSVSDLQNVLHQFAEIRFLRKAQTYRNLIMSRGLEQCFYEGLADVMGYSRNRLPFGALTRKLPIDQVQRILATTPEDRRIIVLEGPSFRHRRIFDHTGKIRNTSAIQIIARG